MKLFKKQLLVAILLLIVGLGLPLLNALRTVAPSQPTVMNEADRAAATRASSINHAEDETKPASLESRRNNPAHAKSVHGRIREWGLESWSRVRRKIRRLV
jgi:hypothetical protein